MRAVGLEPLERYPGRTINAWLCCCLKCKREITRSLHSVRQSKVGCPSCARTTKRDTRRIPDAEAVANMVSAGLKPLVPYPGVNAPWRSLCLTCNKEVSPTLSRIRTSNGGCRYCRVASRSVARQLPEAEAVASMIQAGLEPLEPYPGRVGDLWRCRCTKCGDVVTPRLNTIRNGGGGCWNCGLGARADAQRLPEAEAVARMVAARLNPLEPYPGSMKPWRCECIVCGAVVSPLLNSIRQGQGGCIQCGRAKSGNSRRTPEAEAVAEMLAAGMKPLEPYPGLIHKPWKCECTSCANEIVTDLNRIRGGTGCRYCARIAGGMARRIPNEKAVTIMRSAGLEPLGPYPGGHKPWRSRCLVCENESSPLFSNVQRGTGCPHCAGNVPLDVKIAVDTMRGARLEPLSPYPGLMEPWHCRCRTCGSEVSPSLNNVRRRGRGCGHCAGNMPLDPKAAAEEMRKAKLEPIERYRGCDAPWKCICTTCGSEVSPTLSNVRRWGRGCRFCNEVGFNFTAPAVIYLITHVGLGAHKVGIAGIGIQTDRINVHRQYGWKLFDTLRFQKGIDAYYVERAVLQRLRTELELPQYLSREDMPQRGETETVDADEISLPKLWSIVHAEASMLRSKRSSRP